MAIRFKSAKQKKALLIAAISIFALGIGLTIAYNMDSLSFANLFKVQNNIDEYVETFSSPDDWQPCQEIPKTAIAVNRNDTVRYARMKINKYWRLNPSQISDPDDYETTELPLTWDDNGTTKEYAIVNTQNDNDWELRGDGWYYYRIPLRKDESTNSLLESVTLNCDANLVTNGTTTATQTGQEGESTPTAYAGSKFHLYVMMQLSDEEWPEPEDPDALTSIIKRQANPDTTTIDFRRYAIKSDDPYIANGNGVNKATEKGKDVYYYRGEVDNNFVVFAGNCWKILRTTYSGGVKLIYDPTTEPRYDSSDGIQFTAQCVARSTPITLLADYNPNLTETPTVVSYMFGFPGFGYTSSNGATEKYYAKSLIANEISGLPELDMREGNYKRGGFWDVLSTEKGYYYYCENARADDISPDTDLEARACRTIVSNNVFPAYMIYNGGERGSSMVGLKIMGNQYKNFDELKDEMFTNRYSSALKQTIEAWYGNNISESYRQYVEDPIFCNDRSVYVGALGGVNSPLEKIVDYDGRDYYYGNHFNGYYRNSIEVNNNYHPSLDCPNQNDAFTVSDSVNGNAALSYPVGVFTADELTFAGVPSGASSNSFRHDTAKAEVNYLYSLSKTSEYLVEPIITMTPMSQTSLNSWLMFTYAGTYDLGYGLAKGQRYTFRPLISLKTNTLVHNPTASGTASDAYIITLPN